MPFHSVLPLGANDLFGSYLYLCVYIYIHIYAGKPSVWSLHYTNNWTGDMFCVVETPFRCCWLSIDAGLQVIASLLLEICVQTNL